MAFGHFLLGFHNFMVTALGSCVQWPLGDPIGGLLCELIHRYVFIPKVNYPLQRLESLLIYLKRSAIYYDLNTSVSCMFWKDYTEYEILCHLVFYVTMVTFWMVLLMNK